MQDNYGGGVTIDLEDSTGGVSASGLDLLAALANYSPSDPPITASRLAALTGRDRGVVSRVIDDLLELGFVERDPDERTLRLGWGLYAAAVQVVELRVVSRGQQLVERLAAQCGESTYLVRRRGTQSLTVAEAMPRASVRGVSWLGRSQPVARGDAGPVLLMDLSRAELRALLGGGKLPPSTGINAPRSIEELEREIAKARATGVCVLMEHVEAGVASVGAPVMDFRQRVVGAVVVVGPSTRVSSSLATLVDAVREGADELSRSLGSDLQLAGGEA